MSETVGSSESSSSSLSCSHSQPLPRDEPDLEALDSPPAETNDRPPSRTSGSSIGTSSTSISALVFVPRLCKPRLTPPRGPDPVTDRYANPGSINATRNEHVDPVSPNAKATLGTYRDKVSATSIAHSATPCAKRAATSGATSVTTPRSSVASMDTPSSSNDELLEGLPELLEGFPGVGPPT